MHDRPSWDITYFRILEAVSQRATCPRLHTAAALVDKHHRMMASGYNGSVYNLPHCNDIGCLIVDDHCKRTIHAEANTIINAARLGVSTIDTVMYSLHTPCMDCAKMIAQAGIIEVRTKYKYNNKAVADFLREAGIKVWAA